MKYKTDKGYKYHFENKSLSYSEMINKTADQLAWLDLIFEGENLGKIHPAMDRSVAEKMIEDHIKMVDKNVEKNVICPAEYEPRCKYCKISIYEVYGMKKNEY